MQGHKWFSFVAVPPKVQLATTTTPLRYPATTACVPWWGTLKHPFFSAVKLPPGAHLLIRTSRLSSGHVACFPQSQSRAQLVWKTCPHAGNIRKSPVELGENSPRQIEHSPLNSTQSGLGLGNEAKSWAESLRLPLAAFAAAADSSKAMASSISMSSAVSSLPSMRRI